VQPVYPGAPDSTVVAIPLPARCARGRRRTVRWTGTRASPPPPGGRDAAGATTTGRTGTRASRSTTQDGWNYQPLLPQGEFWGEFASYDVTLDLADDQVIGATGVPVEGDPGWERVRAAGEIHSAATPTPPPPPESLGLLDRRAGRRPQARPLARRRGDPLRLERRPDFVYEGGLWRDIPVHVLYQRGAAGSGGTASRWSAPTAMEWTDSIFGRYAYPQITNLHRIESGGTEFPMLIMDGSASQGLIVHEIVHQYAHAILANNEWRDGWLDEGLTSFLTNWYWEEQGPEQDVWDRR
jgi:hypothetical protein